MRWLLSFICLVIALPALAQTEERDRGRIIAFLEDQLSTDGRNIRLDGFRGSLSGRAELDQLTISDDDGPWLTLRGAVLDWNQRALLSGRVAIEELSAQELILPRLPRAQTGVAGADVEASPFRVPDLPVGIAIGRLAIDRAEIGAPLIGQDAVLRLAGSVSLSGGDGQTDLTLERIDEKRGAFRLTSEFTGAEDRLRLNLTLDEAEGGILSGLAGLPGQPAIQAQIEGDGPLNDFKADITLATDGVQRLTGAVTLTPGAFDAALDGDVSGLFLPQYAAFFGPDLQVRATGQQTEVGDLDLSQLSIQAAHVSLNGRAVIDPTGRPKAFNLTASLGTEDRTPVLLPIPGVETRLDRADIVARFDGARGEGWAAQATVRGLDRSDLAIEALSFVAAGTLAQPSDTPAVSANLEFSASGLRLTDPALAEAIGDTLEATATLNWEEDAPLRLSNLRATGAGTTVTLDGSARIVDRSTVAEGVATLETPDLSRFSALAGRDLQGALVAKLEGRGDPLGGTFEGEFLARGTGLLTGIDPLDRLIADGVRFFGDGTRDETGLRFAPLRLTAEGFEASLLGNLSTGESTVDLAISLDDVARVVDGVSGPVTFSGQALAEGGLDQWDVSLNGTGPHGSRFATDGSVSPQDFRLDLDAALPRLAPFAPGLPGGATLSGAVTRAGNGADLDLSFTGPWSSSGTMDGVVSASAVDLAVTARLPDARRLSPALSGPLSTRGQVTRRGNGFDVSLNTSGPFAATTSATGRYETGGTAVRFTSNLPNAGAIAPGLSGPVRAEGDVRQTGSGYAVDVELNGPGTARTDVAGTVSPNGSRMALSIRGRAPLALANRFVAPRRVSGDTTFDLQLNGPPALSSLKGRVSVAGGRVSLPTLAKGLRDVSATATLSGTRATVQGGATFSDGGRITMSGPVGLSGRFPADLSVQLDEIRLFDPALYDASLRGQLSLTGPLAGGARIGGGITIDRAELRLAETGLSFGNALPNIQHLGITAGAQATRERAGLLAQAARGGGGASGATAFPLDLTVRAPGRIFVRGRGLDAELGGDLRVRGTTAAPLPSGGFELLRGRMDLLGKRITLDEGRVTLAGSFLPFVRLVARAISGDVTTIITVEGPVDDPEITFTSEPELPEDEVLSQLFFGRSIATISPFQAAQLASAVGTLTGRGGGGFLDQIRSGAGLDDLDVGTTQDGTTRVRAGRYISENVYTDVTTGSDGDTEINLKIDLTTNVTIQGSTDNSGDSSIGIFFERDY